MELTLDHFDQALSALNRKLNTKIDEQTKELKTYAKEQIEELARIIAKASLEDRKLLEEKLDVRVRVEKLEKNIQEIRGALHLSIS